MGELNYVAQKHPADEALGCSFAVAVTIIALALTMSGLASVFQALI